MERAEERVGATDDGGTAEDAPDEGTAETAGPDEQTERADK